MTEKIKIKCKNCAALAEMVPDKPIDYWRGLHKIDTHYRIYGEFE